MFYKARPCVHLLIALLFSTLSLDATATATTDGWLRLDTAHFTFFSARSETETRALASDLEHLRGVLAQLFPTATVDFAVPTYLYVFPDAETLARFQYAAAAGTVGYFAPHVLANYAALNGDPRVNPAKVIYKQYIAALMAANLPALPPWFTRGLSDYYSTFTFEGDEARIGLPVRDYLNLLNAPDRSRRMPFTTLLALASVPRENHLAAQYVGQAWGLVHYLLSEETVRERIPRLVEALAAGTPSDEALHDVLGLTTATLDETIHAYLTGSSFSYWRVRRPPPDPASIRVAPMTQADTAYRLGDLLAHVVPTRSTQARELFESALMSDPEHGLAYAGLAGLWDPASREAREHYARAATLAPDDFLVHYLHGESLLAAQGGQRPRTDTEKALVNQAADAFRRSTALRPGYAESWARLGYTLGLAGVQTKEAVSALERAATDLPARQDVAFNLLLAYARAGRRDGADSVVTRLRAVGSDADLARAHEVLLQMDYNGIDAMLRAHRLDDAVAILVRIQAESTSETLRQRAAKKFEVIEPAAQHNQFATHYLDAVARWRAGDFAGAREQLEALTPEARPGKQQEAIAILLEKLQPSE